MRPPSRRRARGGSAGTVTIVAPGVSEGRTLSEEAVLLPGLGAREAVNLDGGGLTAMTVNGTLVNHPPDPTGERADGDAVVVVPGPRLP